MASVLPRCSACGIDVAPPRAGAAQLPAALATSSQPPQPALIRRRLTVSLPVAQRKGCGCRGTRDTRRWTPRGGAHLKLPHLCRMDLQGPPARSGVLQVVPAAHPMGLGAHWGRVALNSRKTLWVNVNGAAMARVRFSLLTFLLKIRELPSGVWKCPQRQGRPEGQPHVSEKWEEWAECGSGLG